MDHAFTAAELLGVWERGRSQPLVDRALSLISLGADAVAIDRLAQLSIGQRDARLLELRERIFGQRLRGHANCPACSQQVEMNFTSADVKVASGLNTGETSVASFGEHEIRFRLPDSSDLAMLTPESEVPVQKRQLAQRCVLSVSHEGQALPTGQLADDLIAQLSERMAELDPQGDVQLALNCPECGHHWQAPLDIASFIWIELEAWAVRLLRDVHEIAAAYGWSEADILRLSQPRRQIYLELIHR